MFAMFDDVVLERYGYKVYNYRIYLDMQDTFYKELLEILNKKRYYDEVELAQFLDKYYLNPCTIYLPFEAEYDNVHKIISRFNDMFTYDNECYSKNYRLNYLVDYGITNGWLTHVKFVHKLIMRVKKITTIDRLTFIYYCKFYQIYKDVDNGNLIILLPNNNFYVLTRDEYEYLREQINDTNLILDDLVISHNLLKYNDVQVSKV